MKLPVVKLTKTENNDLAISGGKQWRKLEF